jgi:hypothetical protein
MKFDLVRPCGDCPFRSDRPAYLRPERVRQILGAGKGRRWWPASSFPCHNTIVYGDADDDGNSKTTVPPTAQQCAGVMIILTREGRPNDAMQIAERFGMFDPRKLDMTAPVHESADAAVKAQRW